MVFYFGICNIGIIRQNTVLPLHLASPIFMVLWLSRDLYM